MAKSSALDKLILLNVKKRIDYSIIREESDERTLRRLSRGRLLKNNDILLQIQAEEIARLYFRDDITYQEFIELEFRDYPEYKDNYTFNVLLGQHYRQLYRQYLEEKSKKEQLLKKLILCYQKRYGNGR